MVCSVKIYLADTQLRKCYCIEQQKQYRPYTLESFYYSDKITEEILIPYSKEFMLDSGAFTFMSGNHDDQINWEEYCDRYSEFIKRNNIKLFFELDIEGIIGYERVKKIRIRLEKATNKQPIPVWHIDRGKEEFIRHCDEYPYVALGGYVTAIKSGDPRQKAYVKAYPWFIDEAHKRDKKIHGLGFTSISGLTKYHFDSVDSTAWTTGNRYGYIYKFNGKSIDKIDPPKGKKLSDSRMVAVNNYCEWIKFQQYADTHL